MKLLPRYATACNLKIGKQWLLEKFFPLPFSQYILLHASAGMPGKQYPYYTEVVALIKPYLASRGIEIVQFGGKDDPAIPGCYHIMGKDDVHQASYLIRNAKLIFGNDSVWGHRAGYLGIPLVQPWGPTDKNCHSSYEADPEKTIHLESHRWGRNPTFASQENPLSIALIDPHDVARAVLRLLKIENTITACAVHVGPAYTTPLFEWICNQPVNPAWQPEYSLVARYDLCVNEAALVQTLNTGRKVNLLTKTPLNLQLLAAFKPLILTYGHEIDETTPLDYVASVKKLFPSATFFTRDPDLDKLAALRFRLFDIAQVQHVVDKTRADFERAAREYVNDPAFALDFEGKARRLDFKTNKMILSNGKMYLSHAHEKADCPVGQDGASAVRNEDLWMHDMNHFLVYLT